MSPTAPHTPREEYLDAAARRRADVLSYYATHTAHGHGPSLRTVAAHYGVSKKTIENDVRALEDAGLARIVRDQRGRMCAVEVVS